MKRHLRARALLSIVVAVAFICSVFGLASLEARASGRSVPHGADQAAWSTYADQRFDFTIEYPADWYVHPRNDEPGGYGGSVIFSDLPAGEPGSRTRRAVVEVGFHLTEIGSDQSLSAWRDLYDEAQRRTAPAASQSLSARRCPRASGGVCWSGVACPMASSRG